jgi:citrate lyase subunit alpha/citrate CoA-transferase
LVTERGIAIHPRRQDLIKKLEGSNLPLMTIEALLEKAEAITGKPKDIHPEEKIVGVVRYRDGSIIDSIYQVKGV